MAFWRYPKICNESCYNTWERAAQIQLIFLKYKIYKPSELSSLLNVNLNANAVRSIIDGIDNKKYDYTVGASENNPYVRFDDRPWKVPRFQSLEGLKIKEGLEELRKPKVKQEVVKPLVITPATDLEEYDFGSKIDIDEFILDL